MRNFAIDSIIEYTKYNLDFRLEWYCIVSEEMKIPDSIRAKFPNGSQIMFAMNYFNDHEIEFDFPSQTLSWNTTFSGAVTRIYIPAKDIFLVKDNAGMVIQFHPEDGASVKSEKAPIAPIKKEKKKPEFNVCWSNDNPDFVPTEPKGNLKLVLDNTAKS